MGNKRIKAYWLVLLMVLMTSMEMAVLHLPIVCSREKHGSGTIQPFTIITRPAANIGTNSIAINSHPWG